MATETRQDAGPFLKNSVIWQKKGPLPVWGWMIVGLALIFIVVWWRRNRSASVATEAATGEPGGDQSAPPIFIIPPGPPGMPGPPGPPGPPGTVPPAPPAGGSPPPLQIPTTVSVPLNKNLYEWVNELNAGYPGLDTSFVKMFGSKKNDPKALNPKARDYMKWQNPSRPGDPLIPIFYRGTPPMRIR